MKNSIFFVMGIVIGLSLVAAFGQEVTNAWTATCTDMDGLESRQTEIARANGCKANLITATVPLSREDGRTLRSTELASCSFYLNGSRVKMVEPAATIQYRHPASTDARCIPPVVPPVPPTPPPQPPKPPEPQPPVTPPVEPPKPQPAKPTTPTNVTARRVSGGYRIDCNLPAGTVQVRLLIVRPSGLLGSRVATSSACGFTYAGYKPTTSYTLKSVDAAGKLSGRSPLVRTE